MIPQPYLSIGPWLEQLIAATDDELAELLTRSGENSFSRLLSRLQADPSRRSLPCEAATLERVHHRLRGKPFEHDFWYEFLIESRVELPEAVAHDLIDRDVAVDHIPFVPVARSVLVRLAQEHSNAFWRLSTQMCFDPAYSAAELEAFVRAHSHHLTVVGSLARLEPLDGPKEAALRRAIADQPDGPELIGIRDMRVAAERAERDDLEFADYEELYNTGGPHVLRALAANPGTPARMLEALEQVAHIKFAREIRQLAAENRARRLAH